jgi:hypothetical protein
LPLNDRNYIEYVSLAWAELYIHIFAWYSLNFGVVKVEDQRLFENVLSREIFIKIENSVRVVEYISINADIYTVEEPVVPETLHFGLLDHILGTLSECRDH